MTGDPAGARARTIVRRLAEVYPEAKCTLDFRNPFELLIATMLSAQTTDERVNAVTPGLFSRFPRPSDLADANDEELSCILRPVGLHRTKARSIRRTAKRLCRTFGGHVPRSVSELQSLPGVGPKTARVVVGNAFDQPALPVDTHVARVSRRLGLSEGRTPDEVERDLTAALPETAWVAASHLLIAHGRRRCGARKPDCGACTLADLCPFPGSKPRGGPSSVDTPDGGP